jgi:hypothetical protein
MEVTDETDGVSPGDPEDAIFRILCRLCTHGNIIGCLHVTMECSQPGIFPFKLSFLNLFVLTFGIPV